MFNMAHPVRHFVFQALGSNDKTMYCSKLKPKWNMSIVCYHKLLLLTNITMGLNMVKNRAESTTFLLVVESIIKLANSFSIQTRKVQGMCSTL